jgi:hypothetical protein
MLASMEVIADRERVAKARQDSREINGRGTPSLRRPESPRRGSQLSNRASRMPSTMPRRAVFHDCRARNGLRPWQINLKIQLLILIAHRHKLDARKHMAKQDKLILLDFIVWGY